MKEYHISLDHTVYPNEPIHACIGYFDGIHKGHQQLIQTVVDLAKEQGGIPALITFDPDPWAIIKGMHDIPHLMSMEERKQIAEQLGVELWIILDFTEEMAALSVEEFHDKILFPMPLATLVCGYDFHYAHYGQGNVETLRSQQRFAIQVIEEVSSEAEKISSTRIEGCIKQGDMEQAQALLTRPYQISGCVIHGLKNGRKMGYPTANLHMHTPYVIPKDGVYAGEVYVDGMLYPAMINVGSNPTIKESSGTHIEAHLFDFHEDLYGKEVSFLFYHYIREDQAFAGLDELKAQLVKDEQATLAYFAKRMEG